MRILVVIALVGGCGKSPCERLAPRLMPDPKPEFIEQCEARMSEPKFARMVECLLAVEGGLYEKDIAGCPNSDQLPLYFHF